MNKGHSRQRTDLEVQDHEKANLQLHHDLNRILKPGGIVLDIGANRGQFLQEIMAQFVDHALDIHAFEPVGEAYKELLSVSRQYNGCRCNNVAISNTSGTSEIFVTESDVGSSLLEPLEGQPSKWLTTLRKETVQLKRLDEYIQETDIPSINLLKSDTQGHDLQVLISAGQFLNSNFVDAILVEANFTSFYKNQDSFGDLYNRLTQSGFRLAWLYPHRAYDEWLWWGDALFLPI